MLKIDQSVFTSFSMALRHDIQVPMIDNKSVILVGTPRWSSLGVSAGRSSMDIFNAPLNFPNIMYTFRFYAASHRDEYLKEVDYASNNLPIFAMVPVLTAHGQILI